MKDRTQLPLPTERSEQVRLLAAAGFVAAEVAAMDHKDLLRVSHNLVHLLARQVYDADYPCGYDLHVPHGDPIVAVRELSPDLRFELRRQAVGSFKEFVDGE